MSDRFNHRICEQCWCDRFLPDEVRLAVRVRDARIEHCCFCGAISYSGIYVRQDPAGSTDFPMPLLCDGKLGACHGDPTPVEKRFQQEAVSNPTDEADLRKQAEAAIHVALDLITWARASGVKASAIAEASARLDRITGKRLPPSSPTRKNEE